MTCRAASRWHSRGMRPAFAPVLVAAVLALAGCGGATAPEPEVVDNGPLGDYFAGALGMSEYGRAQSDAEQELIAACMSDAGFEYYPDPFTDTSVVTVSTDRTRESVAETGWGIIPTDLTTPEAEMQGRWEQILAQPVYVEALERWSVCMGDVGYPGLTVLDDAMQLVENKFEEEFPSFTYRLDDPRLPGLATWEREVAVASFDCEAAADTGVAVEQARTDWETAFIADHEDELAALVEAVKAARG